MNSGLMIGHVFVVVGCVLITFSLVGMYMKLAALSRGKEHIAAPNGSMAFCCSAVCWSPPVEHAALGD